MRLGYNARCSAFSLAIAGFNEAEAHAPRIPCRFRSVRILRLRLQ